MATIFQNPLDVRSDADVYRDELRLTDLAEPLGLESVWGVEHHFTDYTMCPDVLQFLTWVAARTTRVQVGSMVVVLPWHDPVRVAEQVCVLDHMSQGRLVLGIGRGLGRVEFGGFRVPMEESRPRFVESAQLVLRALETGVCELDGTFVQQPRRPLRPAPYRSFRGRTFAAAVSPESSQIMAELGVGIVIIPQKPWDVVAEELAAYRATYRQVNGAEAPAPNVAGWVFVDPDRERAREGARRWIGSYWKTIERHYEFAAGHLATTKGYESYARMGDVVREGGDAATEFFVGLQPWGTPDEVVEKIVDIRARTGTNTFMGVCSFGGMPIDEAERNLRCFATEVAPRLRALG